MSTNQTSLQGKFPEIPESISSINGDIEGVRYDFENGRFTGRTTKGYTTEVDENGFALRTPGLDITGGETPKVPGRKEYNVTYDKYTGPKGEERLDRKTKNTLKALLIDAVKKTCDWMRDHLFLFGKHMKRAIAVGMIVTTAIVGLAALTQNTVSSTIGNPPPAEKNAATRAIDDAMDHGIGFYSDASGDYTLMKVDSEKVPVLKEADTFLSSYDLGDGTSLVFATIDKDRVKRAIDSGYTIHRNQEIEPPSEHRVEFSREMGVITKVTVDGIGFNASQVETANRIYQENLKNLPETSSRIERDRAETRAATDAILSMVNKGLDLSAGIQDHSVKAVENSILKAADQNNNKTKTTGMER